MAAISANCWNNDQAGGNGGGEQRKREEKNKTQYLEIVIGMKASAVAKKGRGEERCRNYIVVCMAEEEEAFQDKSDGMIPSSSSSSGRSTQSATAVLHENEITSVATVSHLYCCGSSFFLFHIVTRDDGKSYAYTKENIIEERAIRIFGDFLESKWRECDAHSTEI